MTTGKSCASKKPVLLTKEQQIDLVVKLLLKQPHRIKDVRGRIADGKGLLCHGLEFSLKILTESVARFEVLEEKESDPDVEVERSKKRKCSDDQKDKPVPNEGGGPPDVDAPVRRSPRLAKISKGSSSPRLEPSSPRVELFAKSPKSSSSPRLQPKASPSKVPPAPAAPPPTVSEQADGDGDAAESESLSVKALKARLLENGLQPDGCVEKAELQALWEKFTTWRQRPLQELQDHCQIQGGPRFCTVLECARYLASGEQRQGASRASTMWSAPAATNAFAAPAPTPAPSLGPAPATAVSPSGPPVDREQDAQREAKRILPLHRKSFSNPMSWGFAVLQVPKGTTEVSAVQRAYRALMRKLHPDRAGESEDVVKAVERVREAKEACERGLSRQEPPDQPGEIRSELLCSTAGRRKIKLSWTAPATTDDSSNVRRYVVAAHDPAYGRALTITVLEPDYSQELRSFVSIEKLTSYVVAEQDLQKMPKLFTQKELQVQVAAGNEAGQSPWTTLKIPLTGPSMGVATGYAPVTSKRLRSEKSREFTSPSGSSGFTSAATMRHRMVEGEHLAAFDKELRTIKGLYALRSFLEPKKKNLLASWLRSINWTSHGSKQDLVERVIFIREAMVC